MGIEVLRIICETVLALSALYGAYMAFTALHMFGSPPPLRSSSRAYHRFAVLICARNEERVIGDLIGSLQQQDYPTHLFDVFVVADNCTDHTAHVARAMGATVFERNDLQHQTKGHALAWAFDRCLPEWRDRYDACVIFDADNVVDAQFLAAMNRQLNAGNHIATGHRLGKNPSSSWIAGCGSIFWLLQTRCFYVPRARMHLPCCSVGGTGFMFKLGVLGKEGWKTTSICEDIEFSLNSIARGYFIAYAPDAVFYDEQPVTVWQSLRQHYRWSVGSFQTMFTSLPALLRAFRHGHHTVADAILYDLGVVVTGISTATGMVLFALHAMAPATFHTFLISSAIGTAIGYAATVVLTRVLLQVEQKNWAGDLLATLGFPVYMYLWSLLNVIVLVYRRTTWYTIPHTEAVAIDEVEKAADNRH
ncbi:MAG TPA: glycosyltransferase family 2 protein [Candidatus Cryosericum sp.]|nr:glycosyltransferase family 2 protein [Candidatus Cryosericum sp.]